MPTLLHEFGRTRGGASAINETWDDECEVALDSWSWRVGGNAYEHECYADERAVPRIRSAPTREPWESLPPALSGIRDAIVRSREMLEFPNDWDEDGAKPIDKEAWRRAATFLLRHAESAWRFNASLLDAPDITPCPDGSVDLHWEYPSYGMLINFPVDPAKRAGFYGDDRGTLFIKGTFDPETLNRGLLDWLSKAR